MSKPMTKPRGRSMFRSASMRGARLLQSFRVKRKGSDHVKARKKSCLEPSSPTVAASSSSIAFTPAHTRKELNLLEDQSDPVDASLKKPHFYRSASLPEQELHQKQRQQGPPGGALRRLERRMSVESLTNLNARCQQREQRLLNQSIRSKDLLLKSSGHTQGSSDETATSKIVRKQCTTKHSSTDDVSLRDLLEEYELNFL